MGSWVSSRLAWAGLQTLAKTWHSCCFSEDQFEQGLAFLPVNFLSPRGPQETLVY